MAKKYCWTSQNTIVKEQPLTLRSFRMIGILLKLPRFCFRMLCSICNPTEQQMGNDQIFAYNNAFLFLLSRTKLTRHSQNAAIPFLLIISTKTFRDLVFKIASRINERSRVLMKNEQKCQKAWFAKNILSIITGACIGQTKNSDINLWDVRPPTSSAAVTNNSFK